MTRTAGGSNPQVRERIRVSSLVAKSGSRTLSKMETRAQIPLGLRRSEVMSWSLEGQWPPHWPRGVHGPSRLSRSVGAPNEPVDRSVLVSDESPATLEKVRRAIRAAAPDAAEKVAYGMPAFCLGKRPLVYYTGTPASTPRAWR